jgi:CheY-like chemotaxis protein
MSYSNLVLVVDDSPDTLGMLNTALEKANMTTLVALEGKQAIAISQKMIPDVILLDAIMPQMDGFETCRRLKADTNVKHI